MLFAAYRVRALQCSIAAQQPGHGKPYGGACVVRLYLLFAANRVRALQRSIVAHQLGLGASPGGGECGPGRKEAAADPVYN